MGVCTDMHMNIEFQTEEGCSKAFERLKELKEKEGREPMQIHDNGTTSISVEDYFDRKPNAEYIAKKLLNCLKDCEIEEVSCDLSQIVDSYWFDNPEDLDEFLEE